MIKISENDKTIADLIITDLKEGNRAVFELSANIGKGEAVIRNTLNRNLKPKGIVNETGENKQNPNTESTRGYKIYRLNENKLGNMIHRQAQDIIDKLMKEKSFLKEKTASLFDFLSLKTDVTGDIDDMDIELLEICEKIKKGEDLSEYLR